MKNPKDERGESQTCPPRISFQIWTAHHPLSTSGLCCHAEIRFVLDMGEEDIEYLTGHFALPKGYPEWIKDNIVFEKHMAPSMMGRLLHCVFDEQGPKSKTDDSDSE